MKKKILGCLIALLLIGGVALQQVQSARAAAPGILDHVQITPSTATVAVGGTVQFVAQGYDDGNVAINGLTFTWSVTPAPTTGGLSAAGLFSAGTAAGTFTVQASVTQGTVSKSGTAIVTVTANATPVPSTNLDSKRLIAMLNSYLNSVGFDNFLGGQWQVKNGATTSTIKAIPGVVQTATATSLTITANGQTAPTTFTLTAAASVMPKGAQLAATDKVVVVTVNDQVVAVVKITALTSGQMPPGLQKRGDDGRESKKTPPGWSQGQKQGWDERHGQELDEDENDD